MNTENNEENKSPIDKYFQERNEDLRPENNLSKPLENAEYNEEDQRKEQLYDEINENKDENDFSNPITEKLENSEEMYDPEDYGETDLELNQEEDIYDASDDFQEIEDYDEIDDQDEDEEDENEEEDTDDIDEIDEVYRNNPLNLSRNNFSERNPQYLKD